MAFSGCMVKKGADQTTADYNPAAVVTWDTEVYDVGGWHDTGSNTSRFTVPSGVSYVRVTANIRLLAVTGSALAYVWVIKDGDNNAATRHINLPIAMEDSPDGVSSTLRLPMVVSGPIAVTPGNYLEIVVNLPADDSVTLEALSWATIEALDNFSGCLVKKAVDQTAADYGTADAALAWDTEAFDVGGWHDGGDNTKLTVPSGVSYVRVSGCVTVTSLASGVNTQIWVTKDGDNNAATRHINLPYVLEDSDDATRHLNFTSAPIAVTAGTYFELRLYTPGDTSVTVEDYSWFAIEKVA
jgi:hypothetical protein